MTVQEIYEDLNMDFQLSKSGEGNTVVKQQPAAGTRLDQGSTIRIFMSEGK